MRKNGRRISEQGKLYIRLQLHQKMNILWVYQYETCFHRSKIVSRRGNSLTHTDLLFQRNIAWVISNILRDIFRISHRVSTTLHITHNCNLIEVWLIQIFLCRSKKKYKCAILKDSDEKIDKCVYFFYMRARYGILIINFFRPYD